MKAEVEKAIEFLGMMAGLSEDACVEICELLRTLPPRPGDPTEGGAVQFLRDVAAGNLSAPKPADRPPPEADRFMPYKALEAILPEEFLKDETASMIGRLRDLVSSWYRRAEEIIDKQRALDSANERIEDILEGSAEKSRYIHKLEEKLKRDQPTKDYEAKIADRDWFIAKLQAKIKDQEVQLKEVRLKAKGGKAKPAPRKPAPKRKRGK